MYLRAFSCRQHIFQSEFSTSKSVRILVGLACLVALMSCESEIDQTGNKSATLSPVSDEQQRLEHFFATTWREDLIRSPASASYLGVTDYQDKWNNVSEAFQLESLDIALKRLTLLEDIEPELSRTPSCNRLVEWLCSIKVKRRRDTKVSVELEGGSGVATPCDRRSTARPGPWHPCIFASLGPWLLESVEAPVGSDDG